MKKGSFLPLVLILSAFLFIQRVSAQEFTRCIDDAIPYTVSLKFANDQILYNTFNSIVIGSKNGYSCESNTIFEVLDLKLIDFYPITNEEYLVIYNNYKTLAIYNIVTQTIKKVLLNDNEGLSDIRKYKSSTYILGYNFYYVNHDNLATNNWKKIELSDEVYITDMNFVSDDFILLSLGRESENGGLMRGGVAITQDGGNSWKIDTSGFNQRIHDIEYLDKHIVAIGNRGDVFVSNDTGLTWAKKLNYPNINHLLKCEKIGLDVFVAGGEIDITGNYADAYIFKSIDFGETWSIVFRMDSIGTANFITKDNHNRLYFSTDDGSIFYAKESVSSTSSLPSENIIITPNPTSSSFRINVTKDHGPCDILIKNLAGYVVMTASSMNSNDDIDISYLPAGVYLLHYTNSAGARSTQKLIKVD